MGILRIETVTEGEVVLTIDEDLDCSGLPVMDYESCIYDEGFVGSLFESFTGKPWRAEEVDCWCTGARTCRFRVVMTDEA
ncbi:MAG: V4R domain-containing protein [Raoultibacter sp.]